MKSSLSSFFVFCAACAVPGSFTWAEGPAIPYVPAHGEPYDTARNRLIATGWEPIPATCDRKHVCWGSDKPELTSDLEANSNCGQFRKASQVLTACTYVIPDAVFIDTVSIAAEH
jgi:hypothetical protein